MSYSQIHRIGSISSVLGDDVLLLRELNGRESISRGFHFELELCSERDDIDPAAIVGSSLTARIRRRDGTFRYFNGIVSRFSQGEADDRFAYYRADLVPWTWLLSRRANCRIFQQMSIPEIVRSLLEERGFKDLELEIGAYEPRIYCVQYRETDLHFISRLLEEVGIGYFFRHEEKRHTLVLFDSRVAHRPCEGHPSVTYRRAGEIAGRSGEIEEWTWEREIGTGAYALTDYNFEAPSTRLNVSTSTADPIGGNDSYEVFDYPGNYPDLAKGDHLVRVRIEEDEAAAIGARGRSDCVGFVAGALFDLRGHYRADQNRTYLLTEVAHRFTEGLGQDEDLGASYTNFFTSLPYDVPYRPLRSTQRPVVQGLHTAVVTGPPGEEIHVDRYGRIKVQFHWDREGQRDDKSSCWIRVSQGWAGKAWGAMFIPRIGQEVIVDFIEGDPDRPIVTGRVYNAEQMPPYPLPENRTQSGIRSRSSKGGGPSNFNEIRFEDLKGSEEIYVQAERNQRTLVKNDQSETIRGASDRVVRGRRRERIDSEDHYHGKANRTEQVDGNLSLTVGGNQLEKVGTAHVLEAGQEIHLKAGMKLVLEAGTQLSLKASGGFIDIGPGGVTISGKLVNINSGGSAASGSGTAPEAPEDAEEVVEG